MKTIYKKIFLRIFIGLVSCTSLTAQKESPKNIIVMIGDVMDYSCIEATNYYTAGKERAQAYESFPVITWQTTFNTKNPIKGATDNIPLYYYMEEVKQ